MDISAGVREKNKEQKNIMPSLKGHTYYLIIKSNKGLIECKYTSDCIFAVANPTITDIKIIPNST